jgi:hypothetical protein
MNCPTCGKEITGPVPIGIVAETFPETMKRIIFALAGGRRLSRAALADMIYDDDPQGGPLTAESVVATTISIHRKTLAEYGWQITSEFGRKGYRLQAAQVRETA